MKYFKNQLVDKNLNQKNIIILRSLIFFVLKSAKVNLKPKILTCFANDPQAKLKLEIESNYISEYLSQLDARGLISYTSIGLTTLDNIYKNFNWYHNQIFIFHFGGHSNSKFLELSDQHARASNLSVLMGMQKNLKLVFLNGCSNKDQIKELFKRGVKLVIATSADIEDSRASLFAKSFYEALSNNKTIKESFDTAASFIKEKSPHANFSYRGIDINDLKKLEELPEEIPWGLYGTDKESLDWKIPILELENTLPDNASIPLSGSPSEINKQLILLTYEGLINHSDTLRGIFDNYKVGKLSIDDLVKPLSRSMPSILSSHIDELFSIFEGRTRLNKLFDIYLILSKFLASIAFADLFNFLIEKKKNGPSSTKFFQENFTLRSYYKKDLLSYLELPSDKRDSIDYVWLFSTINRIINENLLPDRNHAECPYPFIKEISQVSKDLNGNKKHYEAYIFFEYNLKKKLANGIPKKDILRLCDETEMQLGYLLQLCSFIVSYNLISVNEIVVNHKKVEQFAEFIHKSYVLEGLGKPFKRPIGIKNSFTYNNAIVISKDLKNLPALPLTPFLIDLNSYKKGSSNCTDICCFAGFSMDGNILYQRIESLTDVLPNYPIDKYSFNTEALSELSGLFLHFKTLIN